MQESKWMRRFHPIPAALALAGALTGCGRHSAPPADLFPPTMAGVWQRTAVRETPVSEAPDPVPRNSVARLLTASYSGPGKLDARAYELDTPAVGLVLAQRWRPSADTVYFNRGRYFVVVKWQEADRAALRSFLRALEERIAPLAPSDERPADGFR
jgi:hypothetical protein